MFDLQVLAFQTDLTRISTMMMGREGSLRTYPEIGVPDPQWGEVGMAVVVPTGAPEELAGRISATDLAERGPEHQQVDQHVVTSRRARVPAVEHLREDRR